MANCKVNQAATLVVIDTGSYATILDIGMARMLGLKVREASGGDCGTYSTPGTKQRLCYAGVVTEDVWLQLADGVTYGIRGLRLVAHPHPLFLLGGDLLSGGRPKGQWNWKGVEVNTDEQGLVTGTIRFEKEGRTAEERLVNVPTARGSHSAGTVGLVAGP